MTSRLSTHANSTCATLALAASAVLLSEYSPANAQRVERGIYGTSFSQIILSCGGPANGYPFQLCQGWYPPDGSYLTTPDAGFVEGRIYWGPLPTRYFNSYRGWLDVEVYMMHGYWHEDDSAVACDFMMRNTYYWGWVIFQFDGDVTQWTGVYGYCEDPTVAGDWDGWLIDDLNVDWR